MLKFKKLTKINYDITNGSSHHQLVIQTSLNTLLKELGQPSQIGSGDNKIQLEWIFYNDNGNLNQSIQNGKIQCITIYDWKTNKPIHQINKWNIGSKNLTENEIIEFFDSKQLKFNLSKTMVDGFNVYQKQLFV